MSRVDEQDSSRYDFLDWLRVIAIFVLLFYHTGMLFVGWTWHVQNHDVIEGLQRPMDIAHRLRMPLLFVIAGAGVWFALRRRNAMQVLRERSLRLLLPLVVGMFVIVSPQVYFERLFRGQWHGGYLHFFVERVLQFQPYPKGDLSWHHLWFILYLFVYVAIALPLFSWWARRGPRLQPGAWLYALALPIALSEAILRPLFPQTMALVSDWYTFMHYLLFTLFGFLLASLRGSWEWLAAQRRRALVTSVTVLIVALASFEFGILERDTAGDALVANVFTWSAVLAFLGYGRRYLSYDNALLRWARDASYPIYILHQTVIVVFGYFVIQQTWAPWTKYWVVLAATLVSCVMIYELIIRRFALTRIMFGMKAAARQDRQASVAVTPNQA